MLSLCINLDSRAGFADKESKDQGLGRGPTSLDFFTSGIQNRLNFVQAIGVPRDQIELNVFIDIHEDIPADVLDMLQYRFQAANIVLHKHKETHEGGLTDGLWKDMCFLHSMVMSREPYVMRFDGDTYAFASPESGNLFAEWKQWLDEDKYAYVSYPSLWSPTPVTDERFGDYWWASTRFFLCKRSQLDYTEIVKCMYDSEYMFTKYLRTKAGAYWLEHTLGIIAGGPNRVYYPPIEYHKYMVFSWDAYATGLLERLNTMHYAQVVDYVQSRGGIHYPVDVTGN